MEFIAIPIMAAIIGGVIAGAKGRSAFSWVILCLLFPFTIIIILFLPSKKQQPPVQIIYIQTPPMGPVINGRIEPHI